MPGATDFLNISTSTSKLQAPRPKFFVRIFLSLWCLKLNLR